MRSTRAVIGTGRKGGFETLNGKKHDLIILFDGVCNLCNASVDFILKHDKKQVFTFAALQSEAGQRLKQEYGLSDRLYSVVLIENGRTYDKSTAALKILSRLGFPWSLLTVFRHLPRVQRDRVYAWIARNRYQWFGTRDSVRAPDTDKQDRFLQE